MFYGSYVLINKNSEMWLDIILGADRSRRLYIDIRAS